MLPRRAAKPGWKYPLSAAFASLSRVPSANTCRQARALSGSARSSPSLRATSPPARGLLAKSVAEAARFIAERGVLAEGAPVLVRFIAQIASRFGVVVTQKLA